KMMGGGMMKKRTMMKAGTNGKLKMVSKNGKKVPFFAADGKGANRLFLAYCVFMIPSMLWLESTLFHINTDYSWTPFLVIGVLTLASIGNILFGLLAYSAYQDGLEGANMMLLGSVMLSIQCIILDGIVWNVKFPW
ncbi:MAG: hypothetical protein VXY53_07730, partial [Candidatus Thermoplasmatota archaeon]|nr:hypothetical protein [Candidatus Thermoplasmatota archaeon]